MLRGKDRSAVRPWRDIIWLLLHALKKLPESPHRTVYRGMKNKPADLGGNYEKEDEFTWSGFTSTSTNMEVMKSFVGKVGDRTLFVLKSDGCGRGLVDFSLFPSEDEVVLPPNVRFEVESVFDTGNGLVILQCQQVECLDMLLDLSAGLVTCSLS